MRRIKQNDEVVVISGRDRGKRGKVLKVLKDNRALISGVHMIKKHQKPNPNLGVAGGIIAVSYTHHLSCTTIVCDVKITFCLNHFTSLEKLAFY